MVLAVYLLRFLIGQIPDKAHFFMFALKEMYHNLFLSQICATSWVNEAPMECSIMVFSVAQCGADQSWRPWRHVLPCRSREHGIRVVVLLEHAHGGPVLSGETLQCPASVGLVQYWSMMPDLFAYTTTSIIARPQFFRHRSWKKQARHGGRLGYDHEQVCEYIQKPEFMSNISPQNSFICKLNVQNLSNTCIQSRKSTTGHSCPRICVTLVI